MADSVQTPYKRRYKSYFTRSEIARLFEVAPNTVNRWVRGGKLPSVLSPGGRRRYPVEAILKLLPAPVRDVQAPLMEASNEKTRRRRSD